MRGKITRYQLLLQDGKRVNATGTSPIEARQSYANSHPGEVIIAWRHDPGPGEIIAAVPIEASPQTRLRGRGKKEVR